MAYSEDDQYVYEIIQKLKELVNNLPEVVPALVAQYNPEWLQDISLIEAQIIKLKNLSDVKR